MKALYLTACAFCLFAAPAPAQNINDILARGWQPQPVNPYVYRPVPSPVQAPVFINPPADGGMTTIIGPGNRITNCTTTGTIVYCF